MSTSIHEILKTYWGHSAFRPLQEDIINSILAGNDTVALLPTGGGKSICYQVPALAKDGLALVISPLIALMKDQVEQLRKRGVSAAAIHSGMRKSEIDIALDNCIYGSTKLLYVSPERLKSDLFKERVQKMNISCIAIDEAHCISEWGHDFRPAYREIASIRELLPDVPMIALTATANEMVLSDIMEQLALNDPQVFTQSFTRKNLSYSCLYEENKEKRLLSMLQKTPGICIVYANTRARVVRIAEFLNRQRIPTEFYHGGLDHKQRSVKQDAFMKNSVRVMVATNAFGMGVDKPDVRLVVHMDVPDSLEGYFQEAGRAGRDGNKAFAVLLHTKKDEEELLAKIPVAHPSADVIRKMYQWLANYYQLAVGSGYMESYPFDLDEFCKKYNLNKLEVFYSLKRMEQHGIIQLSEAFYNAPKLRVIVDHDQLYDARLKMPKHDEFIKQVLRIFGGEIYTTYREFSFSGLAKSTLTPESEIKSKIQFLAQQGIIDFIDASDVPQLTFLLPRQDALKLQLDLQWLEDRKDHDQESAENIIGFLHTEGCRAKYVLEYFGEYDAKPCGICDRCIRNTRNKEYYDHAAMVVQQTLQAKNVPIEDLEKEFVGLDKNIVLEIIRTLMDTAKVKIDDTGRYLWAKK
ncbi:RecQ family ATP-dependent DNA helicase [Cytophaga aurantiaca]|uniref:RecQ family ATP-dependent DNA helicase n=1 Tax=Cytophaga aurantiaca TaxID=29530 RepID=UPI0003730C9D|nr:RecQ family ATP-dependent DNA helicase [Cytophaga aurantiaca]